jgi:hypothetical protein
MLTPSEWDYVKRLNQGWDNLMDRRPRKAAELVHVDPLRTKQDFTEAMEALDACEQDAQDVLALRNTHLNNVIDHMEQAADDGPDFPELLANVVAAGQQAQANNNKAEAMRRKGIPIATGVIDYFPLAIEAIAELSRIGNDQHNPGQHLHWNRDLSGDESDALMRHFLERGTVDSDGVRHTTKVAWRALALLQKELENDGS